MLFIHKTICFLWQNLLFVLISHGKRVALDRWGGNWNHLLVTHTKNDYTKNYWNRRLIVQVILENAYFSGTQCTFLSTFDVTHTNTATLLSLSSRSHPRVILYLYTTAIYALIIASRHVTVTMRFRRFSRSQQGCTTVIGAGCVRDDEQAHAARRQTNYFTRPPNVRPKAPAPEPNNRWLMHAITKSAARGTLLIFPLLTSICWPTSTDQ